MSKHTKKTNGTPNPTLDESIRRGNAWLAERMFSIMGGNGGESKFDPESRVAHIAKHLGSEADRQRKREQAELRRIDKLTRTQVMAWVRTKLDPPGREALVREIQRIDAEESVLA